MVHRWLLILASFCAPSGCADAAPPPTSAIASESTAASNSAVAKPAAYEPQVGDLIFQSLPHGPLTDAIEGATKSPLSHVGLVVKTDDGKWAVLEALGPVGETPLDDYLARGREGAYLVARFDEQYADKIPTLVAEARKFKGRPYDVHYDFDDESIYCSELIFKAFKSATGEELGKVLTLGELDWKPQENLIRFIEKGSLPLERKMITPRDLAAAPQLHVVRNKGLEP